MQNVFVRSYRLFCRITALCAICLSIPAAAQNAIDGFQSPEILILGDSQLTFGGGPVFLDFFKSLPERCAQIDGRRNFQDGTAAVIGVRSTSLHTWVARDGNSKGAICDIDPKWKVNASIFGDVDYDNRDYVQIGQGASYDFCEPQQSPFEVMFRSGYYDPDLLVMYFLGNAAERWAKNPEAARADVAETFRQLPDGMACVFISTAPAYRQKTVDLRVQAQENIERAFAEAGRRCSFVQGHTSETIAANRGNASHFRRKDDGSVKDPYHPLKRAQVKFLDILAPSICNAVAEQLSIHSR